MSRFLVLIFAKIGLITLGFSVIWSVLWCLGTLGNWITNIPPHWQMDWIDFWITTPLLGLLYLLMLAGVCGIVGGIILWLSSEWETAHKESSEEHRGRSHELDTRH
jgi:hypothetical protein